MSTRGGVETSAADRGETSRFTPGRTFVEKERRLSAPSWMGIGAAAIEGWNLGVEKENYKKQVRADLQDYYQQEFKGLEVGRTGNDLFDQSMQEVLMGEKKKLAQKLQDRDAAFARGEGATWTAEYGQMKKVPTQIANLVDGVKTIRKDILDKYDQIDWDAMSDEQVDEVMTYLKGGSALGLAQTESGLSVLGATRGNMPYVKDIQALTQEGGGPKIILKKNPFNYVSSVVEEIRKNPSRYSYTDEVNGVKTTKMLPMEQLMPYLNSMFDQELTDKSDIRAYASTSNWDEDGMTPELFDISVNNGNDPKDFVKKKFAEIATNLLYPQQQVYDRQGTARSTLIEQERIRRIKESEGNEINANEDQFDWESWANSILTKTRGGSEGQIQIGTDYNVSELNRIKGVSEVEQDGDTIKLFDQKGGLLKTIDFSNKKSGLKTLGGYARSKGLLQDFSKRVETGTNFDAKRFIDNFNKNKSNQI